MTKRENIKKEVGKRVAEIRVKKMHMNKSEFANLIGMKNQYLGTVEKGERGLTVEKVIEICDKTGTNADYLLRGIDNPISTNTKLVLSKYNLDEIEKSFEIIKDISKTLM